MILAQPMAKLSQNHERGRWRKVIASGEGRIHSFGRSRTLGFGCRASALAVRGLRLQSTQEDSRSTSKLDVRRRAAGIARDRMTMRGTVTALSEFHSEPDLVLTSGRGG